MVDKPMTADAEALGARERHRLATAARHGQAALSAVRLLLRRQGRRGRGDRQLSGLCAGAAADPAIHLPFFG